MTCVNDAPETDAEGQKTEMIVVQAVAARWARTAVADAARIIQRLSDHTQCLAGRNALLELVEARRYIEQRPMMPSPRWRVRIVAQQPEAVGTRRRA